MMSANINILFFIQSRKINYIPNFSRIFPHIFFKQSENWLIEIPIKKETVDLDMKLK